MSEPVLIALLFADRVITEDNKKKGIIGTFTRFHTEGFPVVFAPWYIYAATTNLEGEHSFSLNLVYDKEKQVIVPINGKFGANNLKDIIEIAIPVTKTVFPDEGIYTLTFNIDGTQIGSRILEVIKKLPTGV